MNPKATPQKPARAALLLATLGVMGAALSLAVSACGAPPPAPLVRQQAAEPVIVDPARPCTRDAAAAPAPPPAAPATGIEASFDPATRTIQLTAGQGVTMPELAKAVDDPGLLREAAPGEWLLAADLAVLPGTSVRITAPSTRWLKLLSSGERFASVKAYGGNVEITGSCITSWDPAANTVDTDAEDGRGYLLARDGSQMTIDDAEIRYLGNGEVESYGLSWRTAGTTGKITNSVVSHNYYGLYTYEVGGLVVADNEFHDNILYGIDPHTGSHDLTIERNVVHDNGKHGIILAEDCVDSVIRDNIVYRNKHH
ncbi:MAG TPA: right-handed parallel beta-helix repeat-containing protein, partial [Pseudonocardia sp.]|nr:right-handed parallel beta-helix repeat-containing protein [Pseudonocardia sp.]